MEQLSITFDRLQLVLGKFTQLLIFL